MQNQGRRCLLWIAGWMDPSTIVRDAIQKTDRKKTRKRAVFLYGHSQRKKKWLSTSYAAKRQAENPTKVPPTSPHW